MIHLTNVVALVSGEGVRTAVSQVHGEEAEQPGNKATIANVRHVIFT